MTKHSNIWVYGWHSYLNHHITLVITYINFMKTASPVFLLLYTPVNGTYTWIVWINSETWGNVLYCSCHLIFLIFIWTICLSVKIFWQIRTLRLHEVLPHELSWFCWLLPSFNIIYFPKFSLAHLHSNLSNFCWHFSTTVNFFHALFCLLGFHDLFFHSLLF